MSKLPILGEKYYIPPRGQHVLERTQVIADSFFICFSFLAKHIRELARDFRTFINFLEVTFSENLL